MTDSEITTTSPEALPTMLESAPLYVSPTVKLLPKSQRPNPSTLCETCPASVWYVARGQLLCFCRLLKVQTWTKMKPHVMTCCDGYEMAIADMLAKQAEG